MKWSRITKTGVGTKCGKTVEFGVEAGLHQGLTRTSGLFVGVMDEPTAEIRDTERWVLVFPDDLAITADTQEQV